MQLDFLATALTRVKKDKFPGAVINAPASSAVCGVSLGGPVDRQHGSSPLVLKDIKDACTKAGVLAARGSGRAHNYQRFTRYNGTTRQTPFIIAGGGGHAAA